jgi:hypothetical protein
VSFGFRCCNFGMTSALGNRLKSHAEPVCEECSLLGNDAILVLLESHFGGANANSVPDSLNLSTLKMDVSCSSETAVLTRPTRCHIPEYGIIYSHPRENLKSYITCSCIIFSSHMKCTIFLFLLVYDITRFSFIL